MNRSRRRLGGIVVLIIVVVLGIIGWQMTRTPRVTFMLPAGADSARVASTAASDSPVTKITSQNNVLSLAPGDYLVTYLKGDQALGAQRVTIQGLRQTITGRLTEPSGTLQTFAHLPAHLLTPLGSGYLYVDKQTKGIMYADLGGIHDVSDRFLLSQSPTDLDVPTYSTVVNMQAGKAGEVIVTTTTTVFIVKSLDTIISLPPSDQTFLNFTASSYDSVSNRVFLLSSYQKELYYYDLSKPDQGPRIFYKHQLDVNRLVAGGGRLITYFDDLPSLDSQTVNAYKLTRQLAPLVFDTDKGTPVRALDQFIGATYISISPDGTYMAVKKKFGTTMAVSKLTGDQAKAVVAPDMNGAAWQGSDLYIARNNVLWVYNPRADTAAFKIVARSSEPLNYVTAAGGSIYVSGTNDFISKRMAGTSTADAPVIGALRKGLPSTDDFYLNVLGDGSKTMVVIDTKGFFQKGGDLSTSVAPQQFEAGKRVLGGSANDPSVNILQRDRSVIALYQYAGIPPDDD